MSKENQDGEGEISRRSFVKSIGAAGLGIAMGGLAHAADYETTGTKKGEIKSAGGSKFLEPEKNAQIEKRKYGRTGLELPILTMGCMFPVLDNPLILKKALSLGLTTWDTADCYSGGKSEEGIGKYFAAFPDDRKKIFLSTKCDAKDAGPKMDEILNRSFERMKVDYVDQFLLHIGTPDHLTPEMKVWVEKKKKEGKIKFFGISCHQNMAKCISDSAKIGWCDAVMAACNFRLLNDSEFEKTLEEAHKAGLAVIAMKTQGGGPVKADSDAEMKLAGHFLDKGYTEHQAKLMAIWQNEMIPTATSLMPSVAILNMNVAAVTSRAKLTAQDLAALREYAATTSHTYCVACGACETGSKCSGIRDIVRFSMYENSYGDLALARLRFSELAPEVRNALAKLDLGSVEKMCPNSLPLASILEHSLKTLA